MKVYTTLDMGQCDRIADALDMSLYDAADNGLRSRGKYAGRRELKFLLRPTGETFRLAHHGHRRLGRPGGLRPARVAFQPA